MSLYFLAASPSSFRDKQNKLSLGKVGACDGEEQLVGDESPATSQAGEGWVSPHIPNAASR